jgi:diaminobutyrate-2-oxoglutarate transaminase
METCGAEDEVLKFLAPLTIDESDLESGLDIVEESALEVTTQRSAA